MPTYPIACLPGGDRALLGVLGAPVHAPQLQQTIPEMIWEPTFGIHLAGRGSAPQRDQPRLVAPSSQSSSAATLRPLTSA